MNDEQISKLKRGDAVEIAHGLLQGYYRVFERQDGKVLMKKIEKGAMLTGFLFAELRSPDVRRIGTFKEKTPRGKNIRHE